MTDPYTGAEEGGCPHRGNFVGVIQPSSLDGGHGKWTNGINARLWLERCLEMPE
jgi:hypothetical protein